MSIPAGNLNLEFNLDDQRSPLKSNEFPSKLPVLLNKLKLASKLTVTHFAGLYFPLNSKPVVLLVPIFKGFLMLTPFS